MDVDRRSLLKGILATGATTAVAGAVPSAAAARSRAASDPQSVGMLYDATKCIGCKSCVVACREANGLTPESAEGLWDDPVDLSARTKNIIKLYRGGDAVSFMKAQCMHCVDPACASVCMLGALHKTASGAVEYDASKCIGCRYCQIACPFDIPKFKWSKAVPKIVKCELCPELRAQGKQPACCAVCPTGAVIYGKRADLLAEAKKRLADNPGRYQPKIYGEHDGGGTQVLYLAAVPFAELGLPKLATDPVPELSETIQHSIYKGFAAPAALYAILAAVLLRNRKKGTDAEEEEK